MSKQRKAKQERRGDEESVDVVLKGLRVTTDAVCSRVVKGEFDTPAEAFSVVTGAAVLAFWLVPDGYAHCVESVLREAEEHVEEACVEYGWKSCEGALARFRADVRLEEEGSTPSPA